MKFVPRLGVWCRFTEDELLNEIRRVVAANGGIVPRPSTFEKLSSIWIGTIRKRFGSYEKAMLRAGYAYVSSHVRRAASYTGESARTDLRKVLALTDGYRFSHELYKKNHGLYGDATIKHLLNASNWDEVMLAIGAKKRPHFVKKTPNGMRRERLADLSNNDLLNEIGRVWKLEGGRPKYREFHRQSTFGIRVFERRFGSWGNAVGAYCRREGISLQGRAGTHSTDEVLLAELRAIRRKRPSDLLTYDFYKLNGGSYSIGTFQAHFGSWAAAVGKVDATSGKDRKYPTDQLFDELQRLWEELGHQPSSNEMAQQGTISTGPYKHVFGSWTKAIAAFCDDRNKEVESPEPEETVERGVPFLARTETTLPDQGMPATAPAKAMVISPVPLAEIPVKVILKATPRMPSKRLRFRVLMRDGFQCRICGRSKERDGVALEVDHIDPYAKTGETTIENLWTLCRDCNSGKSDLTIALELFQNREGSPDAS